MHSWGALGTFTWWKWWTGTITVEDILDGLEPLDISHAGGEFSALTKETSWDLRNLWVLHNFKFPIALTYVHRRDCQIPIQIDHWMRRDCTKHCNKSFNQQMDVLTDMYMGWSLANSNREHGGFYSSTADQHRPADAGMVTVKVVDAYGM